MKILDRVKILAGNKVYQPSASERWLMEAMDAEIEARDRMTQAELRMLAARLDALPRPKRDDEA